MAMPKPKRRKRTKDNSNNNNDHDHENNTLNQNNNCDIHNNPELNNHHDAVQKLDNNAEVIDEVINGIDMKNCNEAYEELIFSSSTSPAPIISPDLHQVLQSSEEKTRGGELLLNNIETAIQYLNSPLTDSINNMSLPSFLTKRQQNQQNLEASVVQHHQEVVEEEEMAYQYINQEETRNSNSGNSCNNLMEEGAIIAHAHSNNNNNNNHSKISNDNNSKVNEPNLDINSSSGNLNEEEEEAEMMTVSFKRGLIDPKINTNDNCYEHVGYYNNNELENNVEHNNYDTIPFDNHQTTIKTATDEPPSINSDFDSNTCAKENVNNNGEKEKAKVIENSKEEEDKNTTVNNNAETNNQENLVVNEDIKCLNDNCTGNITAADADANIAAADTFIPVAIIRKSKSNKTVESNPSISHSFEKDEIAEEECIPSEQKNETTDTNSTNKNDTNGNDTNVKDSIEESKNIIIPTKEELSEEKKDTSNSSSIQSENNNTTTIQTSSKNSSNNNPKMMNQILLLRPRPVATMHLSKIPRLTSPTNIPSSASAANKPNIMTRMVSAFSMMTSDLKKGKTCEKFSSFSHFYSIFMTI